MLLVSGIKLSLAPKNGRTGRDGNTAEEDISLVVWLQSPGGKRKGKPTVGLRARGAPATGKHSNVTSGCNLPGDYSTSRDCR